MPLLTELDDHPDRSVISNLEHDTAVHKQRFTLNQYIDYDGETLELRVSQTATQPSSPLRSETKDLLSIFGTKSVYVGFTAGTGGGVGNHDILSWEFRDTYSPISEPPLTPAILVTVILAAGPVIRKRR